MKLAGTIDLTGTRVEQEELLDLGQGTSQDVAENLAEMQRINDVLGGTRGAARYRQVTPVVADVHLIGPMFTERP